MVTPLFDAEYLRNVTR